MLQELRKIDTDYQKRKTGSSIEDKKEFTYIAITTSILDSKKKQAKCNKYIKYKGIKFSKEIFSLRLILITF